MKLALYVGFSKIQGYLCKSLGKIGHFSFDLDLDLAETEIHDSRYSKVQKAKPIDRQTHPTLIITDPHMWMVMNSKNKPGKYYVITMSSDWLLHIRVFPILVLKLGEFI